MTDRKLLELAAKAAAFHYHGHRVGHDYENCYVSTTGDTDDWFVWSPLNDDGDALRLAVKLGMSVVLYRDPDETWCSIGVRDGEREAHDADPLAATRRAIVKAAAAALGSKE